MSVAYDEDYYTWTQEQARFLEQGRIDLLDFAHLADEISDMGRSQVDQFAARLGLVVAHLLKLMVQTERSEANEKSWITTITEQRRRLRRLLDRNPGLKNPAIAEEVLLDGWGDGLILALRETGIDRDRFPQDCPFTLDQLLDDESWP